MNIYLILSDKRSECNDIVGQVLTTECFYDIEQATATCDYMNKLRHELIDSLNKRNEEICIELDTDMPFESDEWGNNVEQISELLDYSDYYIHTIHIK